ncbi:hypothetical protein MXD61_06220 [Frankia sp. AgPm24]|uniref:hypothetical protein n=1 Tax=Frankia sp. AgPm24 TaxID=631128 RepID=UPI00200E96BA|nr:hypothetical protein [Frankia sp. AgPm24]MCK9921489.1 hypothetical protein [Frankia sp. AgPm24]
MDATGQRHGHYEDVRWPGRHFLDQPVETWFGDGDTDTFITWRVFRTGHLPWNLDGLGPFQFDATAYRAALEQTGQSRP